MFLSLYRAIDKLSVFLVILGGAVILIQTLWISYGVFMRYIMNSPDRMVTEATALLLVPTAFAGLAYALREDAYPKVTFLTQALNIKSQVALQRLNLILKFSIGLFFSVAAVSATLNSYASGAASEILLWPRFYFWIPVAFSLCVFTFYCALHFIGTFLPQDLSPEEQN